MIYHNSCKFTTYDSDNDHFPSENCAQRFRGAWWYKDCHEANLNGLYRAQGWHTYHGEGINWHAWHGYYYSLMKTEMKMQPKDFN